METGPVNKMSPELEPKLHSSANKVRTRLILATFLIGLVLRFLGLHLPPFDYHAARQTQTLSTIQAYHKDGIDLLHPRVNYAGYPGVFVLELPIFQALIALSFRLLGFHLEIIRIFNIALGLATAWFLYRITFRLFDVERATISAAVYWLAPLNILYQRSLLIDPMAVLAGVLSFYSLLCFFRSDRKECPVFSWASLSTFAATSWIVVMMKALYLWPTILLLGYLVIRSRARYSGQLLAILIILFFCGISFIAWNFHAMQINNNSPITAGIKPTTLLGASALIDPQFYVSMIIRRPKIWLGPLAAAAYPLGLWAIFRKPLERRFAPFALVAVIPPSYLLVFANINNPHDYYQLITTPFLSIIAAEGLLWTASHILPCRLATPSLIGVLAIITTIFYIGWLHAPKVDQRPIAFQKLCKNLSKPLAPGMVFVSTNKYFVPHRSIPEFIYASGLWGEGKVVDNPADAYRVYQRSLAGFTKVDNLVFYGTEKPDWIPTNLFRLSAEDKASGFFAFRSLSSRF